MMEAVLSFPPVASLLLRGLKAMVKSPPRCVAGENALLLLRFQTVARPFSEPATSQPPFGLKPATFGRLPLQSGELILPVLGSKIGICPSENAAATCCALGGRRLTLTTGTSMAVSPDGRSPSFTSAIWTVLEEACTR